ncbi:hypothetical protein QA635_08415 [Bradyrhizobium brasilense]|uniref:hypothetical protein n=1 Tax=Bradyrhizobium brasilense TaxID=1419277 RepID=UPI0024B083EE|nr:hypothetical protein [Bradyrhizobium australafricanum]WFU34425.1 hypothetical protein QA635_08415 [Bradyrhizobium australafricanum]
MHRLRVKLRRKAFDVWRSDLGLSDLRRATINGLPGCVATLANGDVYTIALEVAAERIRVIYAVRNPDKLKHVFNELGLSPGGDRVMQ